MPVLDLNLKYIKPLYYDDKITLITRVIEKPSSRIYFEYEFHNPQGQLSTIAKTTLVFEPPIKDIQHNFTENVIIDMTLSFMPFDVI